MLLMCLCTHSEQDEQLYQSICVLYCDSELSSGCHSGNVLNLR